MIPHSRFALARFISYFDQQKEDLLELDANGICLYKRDKVTRRFAWEDLEKVEYLHPVGSPTNMLRMFSGNLLGRRETKLILYPKNGKPHFFTLELDVEYRRGEMQQLLKEMYRAGVNLEEFTSGGIRTFLMEKIGENRVLEEIEALRSTE